ncbi:hypothetical protein M0802_015499 [Mischocyttarus mexicanus]|nr:hypothetical protein M0802_015499 [Mischocyttarus mexicanus]
MGKRTIVKTALDFNLRHKKPRSNPINREAIPLAKKQYNMPRRNPIRQKADSKAEKRSHRSRSDPIGQKALL